jgi:epsilon-lactone hydrolase
MPTNIGSLTGHSPQIRDEKDIKTVGFGKSWSSQLVEMWDEVNTRKSAQGLYPGMFDVDKFRAAIVPYRFEYPEGTTVKDVNVKGISCKWLTAPNVPTTDRIVYFHGGGFIGGGWSPYQGIAAWLSATANCAVLFVSYRRAPEHRFPAAAEDAYTALRWAFNYGPNGLEPARVVLTAGDSAGGGLAIASAIAARDAGERLPIACIGASALLNLDTASSVYLQGTKTVQIMMTHYVNPDQTKHPLASPLHADLAGLPPIRLQVGSADRLMTDSIEFAEKASKADVEVILEIAPDMPHVWQRFVPYAPEALTAVKRLGSYARERISEVVG